MARAQIVFSFSGNQLVKPSTKQQHKDIALAFGLFDTDLMHIPINPALTVENAIPKVEDYLFFPFRHISAAIVGGGTWKATDFSKPGVLKASLKLLENKPAYVNHNLEVGNHFGIIGKPVWKPKRTVNGKLVPAGIDAPYIVDAIKHPDICRDLGSPFASPIQSASVTVDFEWEPSHKFDDELEFDRMLGKLVNNKMVRRIVTKIHAYIESSLVWMGADKFAKILDEEGNPFQVSLSAITEKCSFDQVCETEKTIYTQNEKLLLVHCYTPEETLSLASEYKKLKSFTKNHKNKGNMDELILQFLATQLGCTPEEVTAERLNGMTLSATPATGTVNLTAEQHTALLTSSNALPQAQTDLSLEKAKVVKLTAIKAGYAKVIGLEEGAEFDAVDNDAVTRVVGQVADYAKFMKDKREYALKMYRIKAGDDKKEEKETEINTVGYDRLNELILEYGGAVGEKFDAVCTNCNTGDHVKLRSSLSEDEDPDTGVDGPPISLAQKHRK